MRIQPATSVFPSHLAHIFLPLLCVLLCVLLFVSSGISQCDHLDQTKLVSPIPFVGEIFGVSVDLGKDEAVIGARNTGPFLQGAVYAHRFVGGVWGLSQILQAPNPIPGEGFGIDVALQDDLLLVGADQANFLDPNDDGKGRVYSYSKVGGSWSLTQVLAPTDLRLRDFFGSVLALDGDVCVVAATGVDELSPFFTEDTGAVYSYQRYGGQWRLIQKIIPTLPASMGRFGRSLDIDGDVLAVGAFADDHSGYVSVYRRIGDTWVEETELRPASSAPDDHFGFSVSVNENRILVGAPDVDSQDEATHLFEYDGMEWQFVRRFRPSDQVQGMDFGSAVELTSDMIAIGASSDPQNGEGAGSCYVYRLKAGTWEETKVLPFDGNGGDSFGGHLDLFEGVLFVSAGLSNRLRGAAYVMKAQCANGDVNLQSGRTDVLFVNGSEGGLSRTVRTGLNESIEVMLDAAPAGPAGSYVLWAWESSSCNCQPLVVNGEILGSTINPTPLFFFLSPQPIKCVVGGGIPPRACGSVRFFGEPVVPWQNPLRRNTGVRRPTRFSFQGVIRDALAQNTLGVSITNAVILIVD